MVKIIHHLLLFFCCFGETASGQDGQSSAMRNQFYFEVENGLQLGYVWHIQETDFGFGMSVGVHDLINHTYNHNDFFSSGMNFFLRYQPKNFLQFDGGIEFLSGLEDEDGDRSAGFFGL